jgi:hypothetical protein
LSDEEFREYHRIESYALLGCLNELVRIFNVFNMSDFSAVLNIYGKTLRKHGTDQSQRLRFVTPKYRNSTFLRNYAKIVPDFTVVRLKIW